MMFRLAYPVTYATSRTGLTCPPDLARTAPGASAPGVFLPHG